METTTPRLREHPAERFAGTEHVFDLRQTATSLQQEAHASQQGHRQISIFHRGNVTMVLFVFEAGGTMREHRANGMVTIHVLDGALSVTTPQSTYDLQSGHVLALDADVPHSLQATALTQMLLTVHRS
jgi:quercetin dioxygenase-like cupin family protein